MQWRLTTAGVALVLACGTPLTLNHIQADAQREAQATAERSEQGQENFAAVLPHNPPEAALNMVELIGEDDTDLCLSFSDTAANQFARSVGTTSCPAAIHILAKRVTDANTYINALTVPDGTWSINGDTAVMNGCAVTWDDTLFSDPPTTPPGPLPGRLGLTLQFHTGWLITNYQAC